MPKKIPVLFVCIENSCRSQMAEAFSHMYAPDLIQAFSAGSRPSGHFSKSLREIPRVKYGYVITMGCGDECPFIPAEHHEDWELPDPKSLPLDEFRQVRDQIGERVRELAERIEVNKHAKK